MSRIEVYEFGPVLIFNGSIKVCSKEIRITVYVFLSASKSYTVYDIQYIIGTKCYRHYIQSNRQLRQLRILTWLESGIE